MARFLSFFFLVLAVAPLPSCLFGSQPSNPPKLSTDPDPTIAVGSEMRIAARVEHNGRFRSHTLTHAACDDDACETTFLYATSLFAQALPTYLLVRPRRAGDLVLHVDATTDEGDDVSGTAVVHAIEPEEVRLDRGAGHYGVEGGAVLLGSQVRYWFDVVGEGTDRMAVSWDALSIATNGPALTVDLPTDIPRGMTTDLPPFVASAIGPGTVRVQMRSAFKTRNVRVVSPDDVVSVTLHGRTSTPVPLDEGLDVEPTEFANDPRSLGAHWTYEIVPVSVLRDGTKAVGGAAGCTVAPPEIAVAGPDEGGQKVDVTGNARGEAVLTCVIGSARAEVKLQMESFEDQ